MQLTPEMKAQINEQKKSCVYCKIVSKEMESKIVFEDDITLALLDIYPPVKGHVVYLLKEHYPIIPYIPPNEFTHFFGLIPQLCKSIKDGMVSLGMNIFIASGNAAGQQLPHFCAHLLPRDEGDGFLNLLFKKGETLSEEKKILYQQHFPRMMSRYFMENNALWHQGAGEMPAFLKSVSEKNTVIYEDEKILCVIPEKGVVLGEINIYSKIEESNISKLSIADSFHLFSSASLASSLVFDALGAQGTNILVRSGKTDDYPSGRFVIQILPRFFEDKLKEMGWGQKQPSYDLDGIKSKIKEHTWKIKYVPPQEVQSLKTQPPLNVQPKDHSEEKPGLAASQGSRSMPSSRSDTSSSSSSRSLGNEIKEAIERLKQEGRRN